MSGVQKEFRDKVRTRQRQKMAGVENVWGPGRPKNAIRGDMPGHEIVVQPGVRGSTGNVSGGCDRNNDGLAIQLEQDAKRHERNRFLLSAKGTGTGRLTQGNLGETRFRSSHLVLVDRPVRIWLMEIAATRCKRSLPCSEYDGNQARDGKSTTCDASNRKQKYVPHGSVQIPIIGLNGGVWLRDRLHGDSRPDQVW